VVVLRFWSDMSVEQVADVLGCSTGTVKNQCARALDKMRTAAMTPDVPVHLASSFYDIDGFLAVRGCRGWFRRWLPAGQPRVPMMFSLRASAPE
jgi:hypothetical protein